MWPTTTIHMGIRHVSTGRILQIGLYYCQYVAISQHPNRKIFRPFGSPHHLAVKLKVQTEKCNEAHHEL
jgi:hypothetical protein